MKTIHLNSNPIKMQQFTVTTTHKSRNS